MSANSSNASSPLASPVDSTASTPLASPSPIGHHCFANLKIRLPLEPRLACLIGQMFSSWNLKRLAIGFRAMITVRAGRLQALPIEGGVAKKPAAKKASPKKSPKTPSMEHPCAGCSWNDPKGDFTPHELAPSTIPHDRKPCGKAGTIEMDDGKGNKIWLCSVHARPAHDNCPRCLKNKHVDFGGSHKSTFLAIGYMCGSTYVDGTCEALKREGSQKLAKLGLSRID